MTRLVSSHHRERDALDCIFRMGQFVTKLVSIIRGFKWYFL